MREEKLSQRERERLLMSGDHLTVFQFYYFGVDSISEEFVVFSPLWFPRGKLFVSLVSCDVLMFYCYACYSLSEKILRS